MSNATAPPTGIYASRHAPKPIDPNRVLPHMRRPGQSPATPNIQTERSFETPRQDLTSRLEFNPRSPEFTPADSQADMREGLLTPIIKSPTAPVCGRSPAGNFSLSEQIRGMAEQQRAVIAEMQDEIVEKRDEVVVLRKQREATRDELVVLKGAWRIVDEMARGV